jgi:hypothetical protein
MKLSVMSDGGWFLGQIGLQLLMTDLKICKLFIFYNVFIYKKINKETQIKYFLFVCCYELMAGACTETFNKKANGST